VARNCWTRALFEHRARPRSSKVHGLWVCCCFRSRRACTACTACVRWWSGGQWSFDVTPPRKTPAMHYRSRVGVREQATEENWPMGTVSPHLPTAPVESANHKKLESSCRSTVTQFPNSATKRVHAHAHALHGAALHGAALQTHIGTGAQPLLAQKWSTVQIASDYKRVSWPKWVRWSVQSARSGGGQCCCGARHRSRAALQRAKRSTGKPLIRRCAAPTPRPFQPRRLVPLIPSSPARSA
jgi:hypothetical protein